MGVPRGSTVSPAPRVWRYFGAPPGKTIGKRRPFKIKKRETARDGERVRAKRKKSPTGYLVQMRNLGGWHSNEIGSNTAREENEITRSVVARNEKEHDQSS